MKIALIQDSLLVCAGSERVFQCMVEEFKKADIFTLAYNSRTSCPKFREYKINTSWVNMFVRNHQTFKLFFPIATYIMQYWDFSGYDIILSSSATTAKYISRFNGKHICFGYYPTRAIWNTNEYFTGSDIKGLIFKIFLPYFKKRDLSASKRVDRFIAQSRESSNAFKKIYGKDALIIHSPIDYEKFKQGLNEIKSDNYLIVSRLVHWKKLEYAIEAFNKLGTSLKIVGTGELEVKLKSIAKSNVEFLGNVDDKTLIQEYGRARALIFTPKLEYGLPPLESNAAGTPVIAYGKGAVRETMIPYELGDDSNKLFTAVFFEQQTSDSLINAIKLFERLSFDRRELSKHGSQYGSQIFKQKLRSIISEYVK